MTARPAPAKQDLVETFDFEQRSPEWFEARRGICTASVFSTVMAEGRDGPSKTRAKLMSQMAAEQIGGIPAETYSNAAMQRGIEMEPAALEHYSFTRGVDLERVGFVRRTIHNPLGSRLIVGCSPDSLVGKHGILQVKTMQPDLIVDLVDGGRFPTEHRWQCIGEMWVTGRAWCDLMIFYKDFPLTPTFRIERDVVAISKLANGVEVFNHELGQLVDRVKKKGNLR